MKLQRLGKGGTKNFIYFLTVPVEASLKVKLERGEEFTFELQEANGEVKFVYTRVGKVAPGAAVDVPVHEEAKVVSEA